MLRRESGLVSHANEATLTSKARVSGIDRSFPSGLAGLVGLGKKVMIKWENGNETD